MQSPHTKPLTFPSNRLIAVTRNLPFFLLKTIGSWQATSFMEVYGLYGCNVAAPDNVLEYLQNLFP